MTSLPVTKQAGGCRRPGGRCDVRSLQVTDYHKIEAFLLYSTICVEWAADHFGLRQSTFEENMREKRFTFPLPVT